MKFLVDMNLSPKWVGFLAEAGFEAVHWSDVGPSNACDADLMEWAASQGHIVLTSDLNFGAILAATRRRQPSVIQIRGDRLTTDAIGAVVLAVSRNARHELLAGAIVSVDATRSRIRVLPFFD